MPQKTTWDAVRALKLIGRDLVNQDSLGTARGPISEVRITDEGWVVITQSWTAQQVLLAGSPPPKIRWSFLECPGHISVVPQHSPPTVRDDGRIVFFIPNCGMLFILPEGDHLDPASVEGLPVQLAT